MLVLKAMLLEDRDGSLWHRQCGINDMLQSRLAVRSSRITLSKFCFYVATAYRLVVVVTLFAEAPSFLMSLCAE